MLVFFCSGAYARGLQPAASKGVLDASEWDFQSQGIIRLDGEWEFYWQRLLEPDSIRTGHAGIHSVATSYRLWINGKPAASNGTVGMNRQQSEPKTYSRVIFFQPDSDGIELVMQVANFAQRKGGLWTSIEFGNQADMGLHRERSIAIDLFAFSALFVLGIYQIALFALRKKDKLSLVLGLFCVLFSFRHILLGNTLLVRFFPEIDWEFAAKLEYLPPFIGVPLLSVYAYLLYPNEVNRKVLVPIVSTGVLLTASVIIFPARVYTHIMAPYYQLFVVAVIAYLIYAFGLAVIRDREGARINAVGLLVVFAAAINDILYSNHLISSVYLSQFGLLFVVFNQTLLVALKFSKAFAKIENLSTELQQANAGLEQKVRERTEELEHINRELAAANEKLQLAEHSRRQLIANISHELGTPMTTIQGYAKAILDGLIPSNDRKTFSMIYQKVLFVNKMIQDLFELSKLEPFLGYYYWRRIWAMNLSATISLFLGLGRPFQPFLKTETRGSAAAPPRVSVAVYDCSLRVS